ncbi:PGPGW domain-containing protein [Haloferula sargassicola]|uniref:Transmembrane protein (PGPGW) n=1 Tax=Haloferula sargassicola TaxID=490096 RepID=A0ABP9UQJ9_9BACT
MNDGPPQDAKPPDAGTRTAMTQVRRVAVSVAGGLVLLVGVALIFLPGPALIVIPAGLAILALEFDWSRRWLDKLPALKKRMKNR